VKGAKRGELENGKSQVLAFAASLAVAYSRARFSLSAQVDYTERRHVRPVPGTVALVTYTAPGVFRASPGYWKEFEVQGNERNDPRLFE
jgi:predicted ribosome quality control (RQC) complex YloA/Tae2 family protein